MPGFWAMRHNSEERPFFWSELKAGRLRQGWGWLAEQDLNVIAKQVKAGRALTGDQTVCWRGNRRLLPSEPDSVKVGDIIVSPHLPEYGVWSITRVTGAYRYEIDKKYEDYGHLLPVDLLTKERPVEPLEEAVSGRLRETMRNRSRMWSINHLQADVERLIEAVKGGAPPKTLGLGGRMQAVLTSLEEKAWEQFSRQFQGAEFERPCVLLLNRLYGEGNVEHTGGPKERGADAICNHLDPLGVQHRVAVQIKMWSWDADSTHPLDQIEEAVSAYEGITAGVILSTAPGVSEAFEKARGALETRLGIPVRVLLRRELLQLFMAYLPEFAEADGG